MTSALTPHPGSIAAFLAFTGTAEFLCITGLPPTQLFYPEFFQNI